MDYGFDGYGLAFFGGGVEFPAAEGIDGVGVQLFVELADDLNAVDAAVGPNDAVENDLTLDVFLDQILRVFRIDFAKRLWRT